MNVSQNEELISWLRHHSQPQAASYPFSTAPPPLHAFPESGHILATASYIHRICRALRIARLQVGGHIYATAATSSHQASV